MPVGSPSRGSIILRFTASSFLCLLPRKRRGEFVPVYVALGLILLSASFGIHTAMQQLRYSPNVLVSKKKRETVPEVVDPDWAAEEAERFISGSVFRRVAHLQDFDAVWAGNSDPARGHVMQRGSTVSICSDSITGNPLEGMYDVVKLHWPARRGLSCHWRKLVTATLSYLRRRIRFKMPTPLPYIYPNTPCDFASSPFRSPLEFKVSWVLIQWFYESFDEPFDGRWIVSENGDYQGLWKHSKSDGHEDYGLLVSEKARKYAIVKELDGPISLKDGTVVLQFEVRLQNGLECGGAYLKYLRVQETGWIPKGFDNESPYSIMFGPDNCGATNKVHFILQHKNPKTGKFVEHHLKFPPSVPYDKLSHVYTAILKPDNELKILIDGEEKKKANFLSADDFEPALIPPKTIPDPDDKKPEDWDERAKISDPDAVKPDDWDEDAPMEIEDEEAVKPEGWLDDEPEEIDDPEATKPEDWDDEEDGEWEAQKIDNPKCEAAPGCGEWKKPMKHNPAYKGKWHAPLIDNPNYKGIWKPQEIDNPDYFELDKPDFEPIAAIGIEIWTMQDGILFDNILISSNEKVAESYRADTWKPKYETEKENQKAEDAAAASPSDGLSDFQDVIEKAEKQPNLTIGVLVAVAVIFATVIFRALFGRKKPPMLSITSISKIFFELYLQPAAAPTTEAKNAGAAETDAAGNGEEREENGKDDDASAPRPSRSRKKA
ncbi:hypothetical protein B296_00034590 [Ensete ventricosum]|uniref:Calnexin n=1 Tax=Ensete ventricosum TaxID=4639 RepID=A0A426YG92_ENSVE|nr:hypothetical protein B296_00034590 [Ensete ventricosum]